LARVRLALTVLGQVMHRAVVCHARKCPDWGLRFDISINWSIGLHSIEVISPADQFSLTRIYVAQLRPE